MTYNNFIKKEEELIDRTKQMIEADKVIKTNYVDENKEYSNKIKKRFKRQWANIERIQKQNVKY